MRPGETSWPPSHRFGRADLPQWFGAIAQLGERLHGMQEVSGSIPLSSTNFLPDKLTMLPARHSKFPFFE